MLKFSFEADPSSVNQLTAPSNSAAESRVQLEPCFGERRSFTKFNTRELAFDCILDKKPYPRLFSTMEKQSSRGDPLEHLESSGTNVLSYE